MIVALRLDNHLGLKIFQMNLVKKSSMKPCYVTVYQSITGILVNCPIYFCIFFLGYNDMCRKGNSKAHARI